MKRFISCHPDDVNLADVKALAAEYDYDVVANRYCPRGSVYVMNLPELPR